MSTNKNAENTMLIALGVWTPTFSLTYTCVHRWIYDW